MHKLAILYGSDMRYYGGGEKYIIEFVNRLPEFDTTIFSFSGSGTFRMSLKQVSGMANAKIEYYTAFQIPVLKDKIILTASGLSTIWKVKDFDAVYCTENSILTELIMAALSRVYGFKYIQGLHDSNTLRDSPMQPGPIRDFLFGIYGKLRNLALLSIPNIRVVNYSDGDKLLKMGYKGRLYKITDFINVKAGAEKVRINRKKFTALFVGRLSINHKGIDLLSQIIEKLLDSNKNIMFRIIGSGDDGEETVRALVKKDPKRIKWLGFVSEKDLIDEYLDASLLLFTSRFESFGLSLAEGAGYGLPAIAFNVRGPNAIMADPKQGKLINPFDTDEFAAQALNYYKLWSNDKKAYLRLKSDISRIVLRRFGESTILPKLTHMLLSK